MYKFSQCLAVVAVGFVLESAVPNAVAADGENVAVVVAAPEISEDVKKSVSKACQWLAQNQNKDGSMKSSYACAATGLAGLAWLAAGSTPREGPYSKNINLALEYVLRSTAKNGFISENASYGQSGMYGHGYCTQFLAQAYGMVTNPDMAVKVKDALTRAAHLLEGSQNQYGGWNASPNGSLTDDGSGAVAIMQITALRAAGSCGIPIREAVITKAKKYLLEMTNEHGWYAYNWHARNNGSNGSLATTGAGMYMLGALNLHTEAKYVKGIKNVMSNIPGKGQGNAGMSGWYAYSIFYASLAIFQHGGKEWAQWYPAMSKELIKSQNSDGSWQDSYGGVFVGLSVLSLQLPYRYLPMFQDGGAGADGR
jgi:hypothetical protein